MNSGRDCGPDTAAEAFANLRLAFSNLRRAAIEPALIWILESLIAGVNVARRANYIAEAYEDKNSEFLEVLKLDRRNQDATKSLYCRVCDRAVSIAEAKAANGCPSCGADSLVANDETAKSPHSAAKRIHQKGNIR